MTRQEGPRAGVPLAQRARLGRRVHSQHGGGSEKRASVRFRPLAAKPLAAKRSGLTRGSGAYDVERGWRGAATPAYRGVGAQEAERAFRAARRDEAAVGVASLSAQGKKTGRAAHTTKRGVSTARGRPVRTILLGGLELASWGGAFQRGVGKGGSQCDPPAFSVRSCANSVRR